MKSYVMGVVGLISSSLSAQEFETIIKRPDHQHCHKVLEADDGSFFLLGKTTFQEDPKDVYQASSSFIFKVSSQGELMDSLYEPTIISSTNQSWNDILPLDENYLVIGSAEGDLTISQMTADMEIMWTKTFGTDSTLDIPKKALFDQNGELVIVGNSWQQTDSTIPSGYESSFFLYKFNEGFDLTQARNFRKSNQQIAEDFLIDSQNQYIVFTYGYIDAEDSVNGYQINNSNSYLVLSPSGIIKDQYFLNWQSEDSSYYKPGVTADWISDGEFTFIAGYHNALLPEHFSNNVIIDKRMVENSQFSSRGEGVEEEYLVSNDQSIAISEKGKIYTVYSSNSNNLVLKERDEELDEIWTKNYNGSIDISPSTINVTKDGGCIVVAKTEVNGFGQCLKLFRIEPEIDERLELILNDEVSREIKLFPNPVEDVLTIQNLSGLSGELCFYNVLGKRIYRKQIQKSEVVDLHGYPKGMYFFELSYSDGFKLRGKFKKK